MRKSKKKNKRKIVKKGNEEELIPKTEGEDVHVAISQGNNPGDEPHNPYTVEEEGSRTKEKIIQKAKDIKEKVVETIENIKRKSELFGEDYDSRDSEGQRQVQEKKKAKFGIQNREITETNTDNLTSNLKTIDDSQISSLRDSDKPEFGTKKKRRKNPNVENQGTRFQIS